MRAGRVSSRLAERFPLLAAFAFPTYRRVWTASFVSQLGDWMQIYGRGVLALELTGKASAVGVIYFATYLPQLLLSFWSGVVADRFDRRRVMLLSLGGQAAGAAVIAALVASDTATLLNVAVVSFVQGFFFVLMIPAGQALLPALVPPSALHSAISFGTATNSVTRVGGPLLGAAITVVLGLDWVFFVNALTFLGIIGVWWTTVVPRQPPLVEHRNRDAIGAALRLVRSTPAIWVPIAIATFLSSIGILYQPLSIVFSTEVLANGDEALGQTRNGLFQAAIGIGAAVGIVGLADLGRRRPAFTLWASGIAFGLFLALLGWNEIVPVALVLAFVVGACQFGNMTLAMTIVQHEVPDAMRGRVMSVMMLGLIGFVPIVSLAGGALADAVGVGTVIFVTGVACFAFSVVTLGWRRHIPTELGARSDDTIAAIGVLEEEG
ncbi:MAG TPA: MFS transporter [Acidimicrobiia bacterium]|nr:MFS transporter [Acidimicrobiia bacterium]